MNSKILPCLFFFLPLFGQGQTPEKDRKIVFPDIPGYFTLKCDLHIHSVFSDGNVWPTVRVQESQKDGIDAMAVTEHLEYQPHKEDIPHPDRNRAFILSEAAAKGTDLLVIRGSEITRSMPPGHANAIFIEDANKLIDDDVKKVYKEAKKQGAFIFWNHPNWYSQQPDGVATLSDLHKELIKGGMLHGIEIANSGTYSEEAHRLALENNLTILGTSDIHGLIDWDYDITGGGHRPVTLVFSKTRDQEGLREALFAGRTAVWFRNSLIGKEELVVPLVKASVNVKSATYLGKSSVLSVTLENKSDVEYILSNVSQYDFYSHDDLLVLKPNQETTFSVMPREKLKEIELKMEALNVTTKPDHHPVITFTIKTTEK